MQTFLPFESFPQSATCLDLGRLNKQIVECAQIISSVRANWKGEKAAWVNHPAVLQWVRYPHCLLLYSRTVSKEFEKRRGFVHRSSEVIASVEDDFLNECPYDSAVDYPAWMGDEAIHSNHRGRLKFKGALDSLRVRLKYAANHGVHLTARHTHIRNYTISDYQTMMSALDSHGIPPGPVNWYERFGWRDSFQEKAVWPVQHERTT